MAELFFADLVRETSLATGAGPIALGGAAAGHRRFADAVPPGATFHYAIAGVTHPEQWETGEGALDQDGTLLRAPLASSAGGAAVDLLPGVKTVTLTVAAGWFAEQQQLIAGQQQALDSQQQALADQQQVLGEQQQALSDQQQTISAQQQTLAGQQQVLAEQQQVLGEQQQALTEKADLAGAAFTGPIAAQGLTLEDALAIGEGGTGATDSAGARSNLSVLSTGENDVRYAPAGHSHVIGGVTGLQAALDSKLALAGGTLGGGLGRSAHQVGHQVGGYNNIGNNSAKTNPIYTIGSSYNPAEATLSNMFGIGFSFAAAGGADTTFLASFAGRGWGLYGAASGSAKWFLDSSNGDLCFTGALRRGTTPVVGARATGWAAASGTATRATFSTASVTTAQLAERMKALIDDLIAHGLIGA